MSREREDFEAGLFFTGIVYGLILSIPVWAFVAR